MSSLPPQYAIQAAVRYYGYAPKEIELAPKRGLSGVLDLSRPVDTTRWAIPPHLRLANLPTYRAKNMDMGAKNDLRLDDKAAEAFVQRYGPIYTRDDVWMDDKRFPAGYFREDIGSIAGAQFLLRAAWTGNTEVIAEHFNDGTLAQAFTVASFEILQNYAARRSSEVLLETEDLWEYTRYLFLTDYAEQRLAVCDRQDCPTPYFVQQRKGQRYCSHDCAVLENVRRFRSKARKK